MNRWKWYDGCVFFLRLCWFVINLILMVRYSPDIIGPLWLIVGYAAASLVIPFYYVTIDYRYYILLELLLSGSLTFYLSLCFPDTISWMYATSIMSFTVAFYNEKKAYRWTIPVIVVLFPYLWAGMSQRSFEDFLTILFVYAIAYGVGLFCHLLLYTNKQVYERKILEQYAAKVEQITVLEERNRLSRELHDTLGHTITSLIMGLETVRSLESLEEIHKKIDTLLPLTRSSLEAIRCHVHDMAPVEEASLSQMAEEFHRATGVRAIYRLIGEEYPIPRQAKLTLVRCLQESLTNAIRHGNARAIQITAHYEPQHIRLQIQDDGQGSGELDYGFGLKGMKERLSLLQGSLHVHSDPGEGTVVTCIIPRNKELREKEIRVLVVDDQLLIRESLQTLLGREKDLEVVVADNGRAAIEQCERTRPHVILMDVHMPEVDGIAATQEIKQRWPEIRVIMLTTFQELTYAGEALQSGAEGYLLKSMSPKELVDIIRVVYRGGTMISQEMAYEIFQNLGKEKAKPVPQYNDVYNLTDREIKILECLSEGLRYKEIASRLFLAEGTVRNYVSSIYSKLEVNNRQKAVRKFAQIDARQ
ncbi:helix-turn-helix transcriptional regulator [Aneurinibacillus tyrosinisolvens]|uniref:helix-turn-helix transcriptional regulator n=1 Tax=Aneurinibacillus tyrosinisolvens TaxID=1443435 RepID=UPI00063FC466|nr:hybrid sensor histidine kinase/response regulator transcription factor [Aneurinibacillus tyrosinisolvens]